MHTIKLNVTIEGGRLVIAAPIDIPADIPDGQHQALIVIEESAAQLQQLELPTARRWTNWPADSIFSREDLYDADGR